MDNSVVIAGGRGGGRRWRREWEDKGDEQRIDLGGEHKIQCTDDV